jgi:tetratricopeptide (TPR) repeat protein
MSAAWRSAQGDWAQAESAYRESLALSRQLVERLGGTPESLRDLSVALDKVGGVAQAQGDWAQAESAYRESLALSRQLVERLGVARRSRSTIWPCPCPMSPFCPASTRRCAPRRLNSITD